MLTFTSTAAATVFIRDEACHKIFCNRSWHLFNVEWGKEWAPPAVNLGDCEATEPVTKIFVGGLSKVADEKQVAEYFSKFGEVDKVDVIIDKRSGRSKGFAFVEFQTPADCAVLSQVHTIDERRVSVKRYDYSEIN